MHEKLAKILVLVLMASSLGCQVQRACLEDEECFGGEFCHPDGFCALYTGCVPVRAAGDVDSGSPYIFDDPDLMTCLPEPPDMPGDVVDLDESDQGPRDPAPPDP